MLEMNLIRRRKIMSEVKLIKRDAKESNQLCRKYITLLISVHVSNNVQSTANMYDACS